LLDETEAAVRSALGAYIFGTGTETLPGVIVRDLIARRKSVAIAESCTSGLLAAAITSVPGSSAVFERGLVTYSNKAKHDLLGVPLWIFDRAGAVSRACAEAMAREALDRADTDYAVAITGIAGPDGGSADKPVGTVWICRAAADGSTDTRRFLFKGDRTQIRERSVTMALALLRLRIIRAQELNLLGQIERF
jgi:nicotinamide-nucleotide amidase